MEGITVLAVWRDDGARGYEGGGPEPWVVVRICVDPETHEPLESGSTLESFGSEQEALAWAERKSRKTGLSVVELN